MLWQYVHFKVRVSSQETELEVIEVQLLQIEPIITYCTNEPFLDSCASITVCSSFKCILDGIWIITLSLLQVMSYYVIWCFLWISNLFQGCWIHSCEMSKPGLGFLIMWAFVFTEVRCNMFNAPESGGSNGFIDSFIIDSIWFLFSWQGEEILPHCRLNLALLWL